MCGILFYQGNKIKQQEFTKALHLMDHRGPDFQATKQVNNVLLGHTRLSILDLDARSNQPFQIGDYIIIFNGEIYNYIELAKEEGFELATTSDTEVLLRLYMKYGEKCLDKLNGMFAFVIYNTVTKTHFIARDRLGIKPLYIYEKNDELLVSSEIAPILELRNSALDDFAIRQYRKLRMTVKNHTLYKDIRFFPQAHYRNQKGTFRYWDLHIEDREAPDDEELEALILSAIKLRQRADVEFGAYLSGGLDSSILAAVSKPDHTWTIGFDALNEFKWSQMVADEIGTNHHAIVFENARFKELARWMVEKRKEPLSVPNEVLLYWMTKQVKQHNTVILSGEGADELFWGYDRIFRWAKNETALSISGFDEKYCYGSDPDNEVIDFALEGTLGKTTLDKMAYYFQITHLQGLLRRVDNSSMLCSVEARVPFVDYRLVEFMAGRPFEYRMGNSFKEPLKRIFAHILPQAVIDRPKMGFPVPLNTIFKTDTQQQGWDKWLNYNLDVLKKTT